MFLRFIHVACGSSLFYFHCHILFHCVTVSQITYLFYRSFLMRDLCVSFPLYFCYYERHCSVYSHTCPLKKYLESILGMELLACRVCKYSTLLANTKCFPMWVFQTMEMFSSTIIFIILGIGRLNFYQYSECNRSAVMKEKALR